MDEQSNKPVALVVGATGVAGATLVEILAKQEWKVFALSRKKRANSHKNVTSLAIDLLNKDQLKEHLSGLGITCVFYAAQKKEGLLGAKEFVDVQKLRKQIMWVGKFLPLMRWLPGVMRYYYRFTSQEAGALDPTGQNLTMFQNLVEALFENGTRVQHVNLLTGAKYYGMHLGPQLYLDYQIPFDEDKTKRVPAPNWYYEVEDYLLHSDFDFSWTVFRPSFLIGAAANSPYNFGTAFAVYAVIQKLKNKPLTFWGDDKASACDWEISPANQLAEMMIWAVDEKNAHHQAFNCTTTKAFQWKTLWPQLADSLNMAYEINGKGFSLRNYVKAHEAFWGDVVQQYELAPHRLNDLISWEFIDKAMAIHWDVRFQMQKVQQSGFRRFPPNPNVFLELFDQLAHMNIIPAWDDLFH